MDERSCNSKHFYFEMIGRVEMDFTEKKKDYILIVTQNVDNQTDHISYSIHISCLSESSYFSLCIKITP